MQKAVINLKIIFDKCSDAVSNAVVNKGFGVFYSEENTYNHEIHTHDCCEVMFCIDGGKNFLVDDKIYEVNPGDVFILNQFEPHKISFREGTKPRRYVLQIHAEFLFNCSTRETNLARCFYERDEDTSHRLHLDEAELGYIEKIFGELKCEHSFGDDILKKNSIIQLLVFLNERFATYHNMSSSFQIKSEQLKKAISYINDNLSDKLLLEDIAKNSYISVNQLCKLFKENLGTTVIKYITGQRISKAKKYLKSGKSVSETAFLCGFGDYANFIRTFSGSVGISPGKYSREK